ncbi:hypothetical protein H9655_20670 [Cytobacillus sp. Sa5YUA1]|uniref:Uncharacterized protein n=1 Tax=Cytobacillus stercorigallinarum TaxID=2762240 RepID=A0ABR8QVA3_9BACI|nr:hypothetical protein [Cytobacillus stercorigallinarum]MBD7939459.1 hypothetical protein [Cytobacillus stercorigallinarum]
MKEYLSKIKINEFDSVVIFAEGENEVETIELIWTSENDIYPFITVYFEDGTERTYLGNNVIWYEKQ